MSRGSTISTSLPPSSRKRSRLAVSANTWKSGNAVTTVSSPSLSKGPIQARVCSTLATRLPWVSIAPLGRPVVPPVYWMKAMSSARTAMSSMTWRAPSSRASCSLLACGSRQEGTCRLMMPCGEIDQLLAPVREQVAQLRDDHMANGCAGQRLLEAVSEVLEHDDGRRARIRQLAGQLGGRVHRIDVDHHHARAQCAEDDHRRLQAVGKHDGNAVALPETRHGLQIGGKGPGLAIQFGEAHRHTHAGERLPVVEAPATALDHVLERGVRVDVDFRRGAGRVVLEPDSLH